jgi:hypothetical protein
LVFSVRISRVTAFYLHVDFGEAQFLHSFVVVAHGEFYALTKLLNLIDSLVHVIILNFGIPKTMEDYIY